MVAPQDRAFSIVASIALQVHAESEEAAKKRVQEVIKRAGREVGLVWDTVAMTVDKPE